MNTPQLSGSAPASFTALWGACIPHHDAWGQVSQASFSLRQAQCHAILLGWYQLYVIFSNQPRMQTCTVEKSHSGLRLLSLIRNQCSIFSNMRAHVRMSDGAQFWAGMHSRTWNWAPHQWMRRRVPKPWSSARLIATFCTLPSRHIFSWTSVAASALPAATPDRSPARTLQVRSGFGATGTAITHPRYQTLSRRCTRPFTGTLLNLGSASMPACQATKSFEIFMQHFYWQRLSFVSCIKGPCTVK